MANADELIAIDGEEAFNLYATGETVQDRQRAMTTLLLAKLIPKQVDDPRFREGYEYMTRVAADRAQDPVTRLLAIAEVVRPTQLGKRLHADLAKRLEAALGPDLPPVQLLKEGNDRLNVARALAHAKGDWLPGYLAEAIACEEHADKTRDMLVTVLLTHSETIAYLLSAIADAMAKLRPDTESPADSVARRQTRNLTALRNAIPTSELEAGNEIGQALHRLVSLPLRAVGRPKEEKVQVELAQEIILLTHEIVRTRFSVATDPEVFKAVAYCRQLVGGGTWPEALQEALSLLIKDVREALILLGRQGVRDQSLLEQLDMLCNYPQRAKAIAKEIAARHTELDEDTRQWLINGRVIQRREASSTALETAAREADESIGLALNAAREARQSLVGVREPLLSALDIYEQGLVNVTGDCFRRVEALLLQVEQVAERRALALYGQVGQEIEFSPKFFQAVGDTARQKVVVRQPAVVRLRKDGTVGEAVLKGLVE